MAVQVAKPPNKSLFNLHDRSFGRHVNRPRVVVLLSSEPRADSENIKLKLCYDLLDSKKIIRPCSQSSM